MYLQPFNAVLYSQLKLITDFRETYLFIQPLVTLLSTLISSLLALNAIPWPHYWVCCCGVDISVWMTRLSLIPIHVTNDTNCTEEHKIPHTSIVSYICLHLTFFFIKMFFGNFLFESFKNIYIFKCSKLLHISNIFRWCLDFYIYIFDILWLVLIIWKNLKKSLKLLLHTKNLQWRHKVFRKISLSISTSLVLSLKAMIAHFTMFSA